MGGNCNRIRATPEIVKKGAPLRKKRSLWHTRINHLSSHYFWRANNMSFDHCRQGLAPTRFLGHTEEIEVWDRVYCVEVCNGRPERLPTSFFPDEAIQNPFRYSTKTPLKLPSLLRIYHLFPWNGIINSNPDCIKPFSGLLHFWVYRNEYFISLTWSNGWWRGHMDEAHPLTPRSHGTVEPVFWWLPRISFASDKSVFCPYNCIVCYVHDYEMYGSRRYFFVAHP